MYCDLKQMYTELKNAIDVTESKDKTIYVFEDKVECHYDEQTGFQWFKNGKRHRDNGPAVFGHDRINLWYQNDKLHRDDGPAMTDIAVDAKFDPNKPVTLRKNGVFRYGHFSCQIAECWLQNGEIHRCDGPAIIYNDGSGDWVINGNPYDYDGFAKSVITDQVNQWMNDNQISYPFTPEVQTFFLITFGEHQR